MEELKIEKGDIVEVINLRQYDGLNTPFAIGGRFIALNEPYPEPYPNGQINVLAPGHCGVTQSFILYGGQYTLYKKNPLTIHPNTAQHENNR